MISVKDFAKACRLLRRQWAEVEGCVVRGDQPSIEHQVKKMLRSGHTVREVESMFNHEHMSMRLSVLGSADYDTEDARVIAEVVAAITERDLHAQFPNKRFEVAVYDEKDDITVVCRQESPNPLKQT